MKANYNDKISDVEAKKKTRIYSLGLMAITAYYAHQIEKDKEFQKSLATFTKSLTPEQLKEYRQMISNKDEVLRIGQMIENQQNAVKVENVK